MAQVLIVVLILVGVFFDQISKYLVVTYMELEQSVNVIPGVFRFTYIHNKGAAFGSLSGNRWFFMILSSVAILGIIVYIFWKKPKSKLLLSALILITSGGIGNMIDRIRLGYVIDFLDFCAFPNLWMWIFNVADSFVVIGAGVLILWMLLDFIKESKAEKAKKLASQLDSQDTVAELCADDEKPSQLEESDTGAKNTAENADESKK